MHAPRLLRPAPALLALTLLAHAPPARAQPRPAPLQPAPRPPGTVETPPAPSSPGMREDDVFARWLASSQEVAAWRTQISAARFDVVTATLFPNPQLGLSLNTLLTGTPPDGQVGYQGQLTFALPIFGQLGARRRAAEGALSVAEVNVLVQLWSRAGEIQDAMVDRAFADAQIKLLQGNLDELASLERVIRARAGAGANSEYDVLRVATSAATIRAAIADATIRRERDEARLLGLVGDPTLTAAPVTVEGLANFRGPEDENALVELALRRRPDLELARRAVVAAEASASRYRFENVPTPSVWGAAYVTQGEYSVSTMVGVQLTLPTFDRNQGNIGHALMDAQGARWMVAALEARVRSEVSGAWRARAHARAALQAFRDTDLLATTSLLHRAVLIYQAGNYSIVELLDAYRAMWDARNQEFELQHTMADAEAELERAAALVTFDASPAR